MLASRVTKKCWTYSPASVDQLSRNTCDEPIALAPSSSASSRCMAASIDASPSSTPPPAVVQYGARPGLVRLISTR